MDGKKRRASSGAGKQAYQRSRAIISLGKGFHFCKNCIMINPDMMMESIGNYPIQPGIA
jgi:hypothetical protein